MLVFVSSHDDGILKESKRSAILQTLECTGTKAPVYRDV